MSSLEIRLLGKVEIRRSGVVLPAFPTVKALSLFALLVIERDRSHPREVLAERFWPEQPGDRARRALRTEVWRIRKGLSDGQAQPDYIEDDGHALRFNTDTLQRLDLAEFDRAFDALTDGGPSDHRALQRATRICRGELLEGLYDDWCLYYRELYRTRFLRVMECLMEAAGERGDWRAAIDLGLRILFYDRLAEHIHRGLMRCYMAIGNRPAAIRQYETLARLLASELDVEPMPETRALFAEVRASARSLAPIGQAAGARGAGSMAETLRNARDSLDHARQGIDAALDRITSSERKS